MQMAGPWCQARMRLTGLTSAKAASSKIGTLILCCHLALLCGNNTSQEGKKQGDLRGRATRTWSQRYRFQTEVLSS